MVDLGCGEGRLLRELLAKKQFEKIIGVDTALRSLERAERRLRLDQMSERQRARIDLLHGALTYRDRRLDGYDAAALVEVIEHVDADRLSALERSLFEFMAPRTVIVTTPNREYNTLFEGMAEGALRHRDHRFEWTRAEFEAWAEASPDDTAIRFASRASATATRTTAHRPRWRCSGKRGAMSAKELSPDEIDALIDEALELLDTEEPEQALELGRQLEALGIPGALKFRGLPSRTWIRTSRRSGSSGVGSNACRMTGGCGNCSATVFPMTNNTMRH